MRTLVFLSLLFQAMPLWAENLTCENSLFEMKTLKSGCLWVKNRKDTKVQFLHGEVSSQQSDFFISYEGSKVWIYNHLGNLHLKLRDGRKLTLPAGFGLWVSEIQKNKKNAMGVISAVPLKEHLTKLVQIWPGTRETFKTAMGPLVERWGNTTEIASQYYEGLAKRRIASASDRERQVQERQQTEAEIRLQQKKKLFERVFTR